MIVFWIDPNIALWRAYAGLVGGLLDGAQLVGIGLAQTGGKKLDSHISRL
jgi:hypothetical protein